ERLATKISNLLGLKLNKDPVSISGGFDHLAKKRWRYFDELVTLEKRMKDTLCGSRKIRLWDILKKTISANSNQSWDAKGSFETTAARFMDALRRQFPREKSTISDSFWWMIVLGFFEYQGIKKWWVKETWNSSCEYAEISKRGLRLISKIERLSQTKKAVAATTTGK
ncbi:MAG TPA: hypothetical protein VI685_05310, partial [Candidatus Angelobacter sp.]